MHVSRSIPVAQSSKPADHGALSTRGFKFAQLEMSKLYRYHLPLNIVLKWSPLALEVILSVMLSTFSFELTDKEIAWNTGSISFPTMGLDSTKPELLLRVKCL